MVTRRAFIGTLAGGLLAAPFAAEAQQAGKIYRIGTLLPLGVTPPILARFLGACETSVGWNQGFVAEPRFGLTIPPSLLQRADQVIE